MVERFHRHLKTGLKARLTNGNWVDELPVVLLGIRTTLKEDLSCSAAEMVYGTTLRLPGDFFTEHTQEDPSTQRHATSTVCPSQVYLFYLFYLINSPKLHSVDHKIDNIYNGI